MKTAFRPKSQGEGRLAEASEGSPGGALESDRSASGPSQRRQVRSIADLSAGALAEAEAAGRTSKHAE